MNHPNEREIPDIVDPLGETLYMLRLNGSLYCQSEFTAPWGINLPPFDDKMMFHIVIRGDCYLTIEGKDPVHLREGDFALLPKGEGHALRSTPEEQTIDLFDIPIRQVSERYEHLVYSGEPNNDGALTEAVCGVVSFDSAVAQQLIKQLPSVINVSRKDVDGENNILRAAQMMADEARRLRPGGETVMAHLSDIVIIQSIRHWIEHAPEANEGWLGALKDDKVGKALAVLHSKPAESWTVDSLARHVGMSRASLAAKFSSMVGISVKQYLTNWRMSVARSRLANETITLGNLAEELGYQSEASFSRAYKRVMGVSPVRQL
jgi:AraC-like DNA-binding protein